MIRPISLDEAKHRIKWYADNYLESDTDRTDEIKEITTMWQALCIDDPDALVSRATKSQVWWDTICKITAINLENERPEKAFRLFASSVLAGELTRPTTRDPKHTYRDTFVRTSIALLSYWGYSPLTRNDSSKHIKSACDIVCDAIPGLGYESTKKIWSKTTQEDRKNLLILAVISLDPKSHLSLEKIRQTIEINDTLLDPERFGGKWEKKS